MSDLAGLLERVKAATGPMCTREIEECIALSPWYDDDEYFRNDSIFWNDFCRALQGSVDAALALQEKVLPGCRVNLFYGESIRGCHCELYRVEPTRAAGKSGDATTLPLAIIAATLTAIISQKGKDLESESQGVRNG